MKDTSKTILILAIFLIGTGYAPRIKEGHITYLQYDDSINLDKCKEIINLTGNYSQGIHRVFIFKKPKGRIMGEYFWFTEDIYLYRGCAEPDLIHELAHHCQKQRGDSLFTALHHKGDFKKCEQDIYSEAEQNRWSKQVALLEQIINSTNSTNSTNSHTY